MEIIKNAYVTQNAAYYNSGGIVMNSQRIHNNHPIPYWQQGNFETPAANNFENIKPKKIIDQAIYVGRIPTHFGHFIMEGLPRLCDIVSMNIPIIGYATKGNLPPSNTNWIDKDSVDWVIKTLSNKKFHEVCKDEVYQVKNLYVPYNPYHLSHSCSEPWRMSEMINKIVLKAIEDNPKIKQVRELDLPKYAYKKYPHISKQIAKVAKADKITGDMGSNTHLSIFASHKAKTNWESRGHIETDRNQAICDIVKSYNIH